ncbi:nucleotide sugar dehydrogenase [Prochlorococcus marinus]|uniref:nucleotide sugar dehydrogenase n=1 Tax=Prochlorococcus marinus TaxID=1219 RepID=UPI001ADADF00|nr:nucleotide sugar dehydrogenase [Prochlorococcus marinus]MBO8221453.1 nucleotide sugar dehydrogenase [Prochlorococcus marinus CUG1417]MBW3074264.1 nucleotide sugar dehydrogenase [Prochlorococcus marinus str. MU1417]
MKNKFIKNICCIGAGYVGGPTMSVIAFNCPELRVDVVDINKERIEAWNSEDFSKLPIFEPGLEDIIKKCRGVNLFFSNNVEESISKADIIFISVNTPTKKKGIGAGFASDLKWVESSARQIAKFARNHTVVVEKSTLPVKTAETIKSILNSSEQNEGINKMNIQNNQKSFSIVSNPEFLAEGTAINDLQKPDRVLIGGEDHYSIDLISDIYQNWVDKEKIITTNLWSSELSKLVSNAFLAQRISSINSISAICEATGANINEVAKAIGTDTRIGSKFLQPGPGFGGSCFKKDILNLVYLCKFYGLNEVADYWEQVVDINQWQQNRISSLVIRNLFGTLSNKKLAVYGFSFKANTNDTRESPSINVSINLLQEGAKLSFYDPKVSEKQILSEFENNINEKNVLVNNTALKAAEGADAIIVLTEWEEFNHLDWEDIFKIMRKPAWVFDTRVFLDKQYLKNIGFKVWSLGT